MRRLAPAAGTTPVGVANAGAHHLLPTRRSLAVGFALLALAGAAYAAARESSAFAVAHIDVRGASPGVRAQVRQALAPLLGTTLLALDGTAVKRRVEALPTVVTAEYDRAFPHTLRVAIVAEKPVAVLRRGREAWLVSARGRVTAQIPRPDAPPLPRIWVATKTAVSAGSFLAASAGGIAARALALATRFPARIAVAELRHGQLAFRLRSGLELGLGEPTDIRLKLAIARRALAQLPSGATYLDVSVPGRPVAGVDSQVSD
jgi:cell division protein FtsQ